MSKTIGDNLTSVAHGDCVAYRRDRTEYDVSLQQISKHCQKKANLHVGQTNNIFYPEINR